VAEPQPKKSPLMTLMTLIDFGVESGDDTDENDGE